MKRLVIKTVSLLLLLAFSANTCCYGLATLPASQNPIAKREIEAALQRTQVRYAESEDAIRLLNANNASCLLLSSGKYLVTKEVAESDLKLLRAIIHEDIEAIMQIIAKEDRHKYQGIKELILKYFPPSKDNKLPIDLYINHTVERAFEWLSLLEDRIIVKGEIPPEEAAFISAITPIIMANKHNYFTEEFWDFKVRGKKIRDALNNGIVFYSVASSVKIERIPKVIFFDIDGVLLTIPPDRYDIFAQALLPYGVKIAPDKLREIVYGGDDRMNRARRGKIAPEEIIDNINEELKKFGLEEDLTLEQFCELHSKGRKTYSRLFPVLTELKQKGMRFGVISDRSVVDAVYIKRMLEQNFPEIFDDEELLFFSCDLHMTKDEQALFHHVEDIAKKKFGIQPKEMLFIDDNEKNVASACAADMAGKQYNLLVIMTQTKTIFWKYWKAITGVYLPLTTSPFRYLRLRWMRRVSQTS